MLVLEAIVLFEQEYVAMRGLSTSTLHNYREAVASFVKDVPDKKITEITPNDILHWKQCMEKRNKPGTVRANMSKMKNILIFTNKKGITNFDTTEIYLPKLPPPLPDFLTPGEVQELIDTTQSLRNKALISLLYTTGLRAGEATRLTTKDIDGLTVYVRQGKCNTSRTVFMAEKTRELLDDYLTTREDSSEIIFLSRRHTKLRPGSVNNELQKIAALTTIKKPVHTHILRHSFATTLVRGGIDISYVQRLMGHAFVSTTQIYVHLTNRDLSSAHQKVFN